MSSDEGRAAWRRATAAAAVFAIDPPAFGICVRAAAGPVRARWLELARVMVGGSCPWRRLPPGITDDRLLGGLDLAATLATGQTVAARGLLAEVDGGVLVLTMAERLAPAVAARVSAVTDTGTVVTEREGIADCVKSRFGLIALDESVDAGEMPPPGLLDRLAMVVDLTAVGLTDAKPVALVDAIETIRQQGNWGSLAVDDGIVAAICDAAAALGIRSLRPPLFAVRVARAIAALRGGRKVELADARVAAELVLGPRAESQPAASEEAAGSEQDSAATDTTPAASPNDATADRAADTPESIRAQDDVLVDAAKATLPPRLLAGLAHGAPPRSAPPTHGRAGAEIGAHARGRAAGTRQGSPQGHARLNVLATLRAAAPWQALRRAERGAPAAKRIEIRGDDFRITRQIQRTGTTTIFVVDASGSAAMHRLAEAKGAVELMLAESYVRRDTVALIAFRDRRAELLLPPTRSLVRAKRCLAGLPGGGGTPLASGIDAAASLARAVRLKGAAPAVVMLSDGRPNIARSGEAGRTRAFDDAIDAARGLAAERVAAVWIDTGRRPEPRSRRLAAAMHARWLALPAMNAAAIKTVARGAGNVARGAA